MNAPANTRPDRIVVVDDDARIRDLLRRYLTQEGFEVLLAEDAKATALVTLQKPAVAGTLIAVGVVVVAIVIKKIVS